LALVGVLDLLAFEVNHDVVFFIAIVVVEVRIVNTVVLLLLHFAFKLLLNLL